MARIFVVVGTRPNFIKITQFKKLALEYPGLDLKIVHTGQHFDDNMAKIFFEQFQLVPDFFLNIQPAEPLVQITAIMGALGDLFKKEKPDLVIAVGDVNSTLAAAVTANKMGIKLAHLESGLRSFDRSMPEEHNRIVTDHLADYFFITEESGMENLKAEGKNENLMLVGNTMIDTIVAFESKIQHDPVLEELNLNSDDFILTTIHRPATVDDPEQANKLVSLLRDLSEIKKVVFPMHPRTVRNFIGFEIYDQLKSIENVKIIGPLGYFPFQKLIAHCSWILTDSGGIQEESTYRLKPCLTLRNNTERPVTISLGTNTLVDFNNSTILNMAERIGSGNYKQGKIPPLWDGNATARIMKLLSSIVA